MVQGERYLGYSHGHQSVEALSSAVCYAAISSVTENKCRAMFNASKATLTAAFRATCESAIERSGLLTTRDSTVLQAFVLYLVSM